MPGEAPGFDYQAGLANERTFLAWIRTSLARIATRFLIVRGGFTGDESAALAIFAGLISLIVIATALKRCRNLGAAKPALFTNPIPSMTTGGIFALALIAGVQVHLMA
jgi:uncharacterized membrane protein YidH (DUF202 family)